MSLKPGLKVWICLQTFIGPFSRHGHIRGIFCRVTTAISCVRIHRAGGVEQIRASAENSVIIISFWVSPSDALLVGGCSKGGPLDLNRFAFISV